MVRLLSAHAGLAEIAVMRQQCSIHGQRIPNWPGSARLWTKKASGQKNLISHINLICVKSSQRSLKRHPLLASFVASPSPYN